MKKKVKIGYVGMGRRGNFMLKECFTKMSDVEIVTVCDSYEPSLKNAEKIFKEAGLPTPVLTTNYDDIIKNPEIEAVVIMTGWHEHIPLAKKSMLAGKYTAIEVGCAFDLSECFELIDIYEKTGAPLMMLENCCYGRREMMALNMVKQGLFGEVVHCRGGYMHMLAEEELFKEIDCENPHYRISSYVSRNCEQYPTHEVGPIAKVLNINRGNRFLSLSSFASKSAGLKEYAKTYLGEDSKWANIEYNQGDIITTVITCANGETVQLSLDTTLPRPYYSRDFTVRGTKGMCCEERNIFFLEGMKESREENEKEMFEKYDHPLHKEYVSIGEAGGHGGIDWLVSRAFIESVKNGTNTPIDAYDTVTMLAIAPLSEMSISQGGEPVHFPDFTKGKWIKREPAIKSKYSLDEICEDLETPIFPPKN